MKRGNPVNSFVDKSGKIGRQIAAARGAAFMIQAQMAKVL
jgi:hypothetical protein